MSKFKVYTILLLTNKKKVADSLSLTDKKTALKRLKIAKEAASKSNGCLFVKFIETEVA